MTTPDALRAFRIPELGPSLGKLVTGTGRDPRGMPLERFRYQLVTRVIESAGEARRLAASGQHEAAVHVLGRRMWLDAWEEAVTAVADRFVERLGTYLEAEAKAARMPRRLRAAAALDPIERRALAARLGCVGAGLVPVLDAMEHAGTGVAAAAVGRDAWDDWRGALTRVARRLEAAWLALETAVAKEVDRWRSVAEDISRWRKPWWPVFVVGAAVISAALWIGLVLGGYLPAPGWVIGLR